MYLQCLNSTLGFSFLSETGLIKEQDTGKQEQKFTANNSGSHLWSHLEPYPPVHTQDCSTMGQCPQQLKHPLLSPDSLLGPHNFRRGT